MRYLRILDKGIRKMLPQILKKQEQEDQFPCHLQGDYKSTRQLWLNKSLLKVLGFDFERGGLV